ncbi:hypothetical protein N658DRAFT_561479 [Parathielavia hyrcaniae]|uniref:Uncharacterized protein n=1 Tax=Parathielavia hyrcaniae TaxID=113614 RepID=A0AAN6PTX0_9PEZI|nr:hypothetical protein N658DRAFT_561479 [Parathielavia hyrcaniae]
MDANRHGPTKYHAEDVAINMMLDFQDGIEAAREAAARDRKASARDAPSPPAPRIHWLGDKSMVIFGKRAFGVPAPPTGNRSTDTMIWTVTPEGQQWPCGPRETEPCNRKQPSCQEVLDRMRIKWRFGIIPPKEPSPEYELPPLPPEYPQWGGGGGGSGGGEGGGGAYHPGFASGPQQPTSSNYGTEVISSDYSSSGNVCVQYVMASGATAAKRGDGPVHTNRSKRPSRQAVRCSCKHPPGTIQGMLQKPASLSDSLAKLSLEGRPGPVQQPSANFVSAQHQQTTNADGSSDGRVSRAPAQVLPTTTGTPGAAKHVGSGQQVPAAQARPRATAAAQVPSTTIGTPGASKKPPHVRPSQQVSATQARSKAIAPVAEKGATRHSGSNAGSVKTVLTGGTKARRPG